MAVLRLMTSSNFVGCSTGRSAGFSPLRMRIGADLSIGVSPHGPITHQDAFKGEFALFVNRRQPMLRGRCDQAALAKSSCTDFSNASSF